MKWCGICFHFPLNSSTILFQSLHYSNFLSKIINQHTPSLDSNIWSCGAKLIRLIDFLPMDIDFVDPLQKIRQVQVKIPEEIQEITNRLDGPFNSPEYSEDIYEYLQVWTHCSLRIIHCFIIWTWVTVKDGGEVPGTIKWFWFDLTIIWFVWYVYYTILRKARLMKVYLIRCKHEFKVTVL